MSDFVFITTVFVKSLEGEKLCSLENFNMKCVCESRETWLCADGIVNAKVFTHFTFNRLCNCNDDSFFV